MAAPGGRGEALANTARQCLSYLADVEGVAVSDDQGIPVRQPIHRRHLVNNVKGFVRNFGVSHKSVSSEWMKGECSVSGGLFCRSRADSATVLRRPTGHCPLNPFVISCRSSHSERAPITDWLG